MIIISHGKKKLLWQPSVHFSANMVRKFENVINEVVKTLKEAL